MQRNTEIPERLGLLHPSEQARGRIPAQPLQGNGGAAQSEQPRPCQVRRRAVAARLQRRALLTQGKVGCERAVELTEAFRAAFCAPAAPKPAGMLGWLNDRDQTAEKVHMPELRRYRLALGGTKDRKFERAFHHVAVARAA